MALLTVELVAVLCSFPLACGIAQWSTAVVAAATGVSAAVVLLVREFRREASGGIPPRERTRHDDVAQGESIRDPAGQLE